MQVKIWGARGSFPVSGSQFVQFGHHTPCLEVLADDQVIVLDAGSGATALAPALRERGIKQASILLSHFHHDHTMGLPFLLHALSADTVLHTAHEGRFSAKTALNRLFSPPFFPLEASAPLRAIRYRRHKPGATFTIGKVNVRTATLDHPGGSTAFRLDFAGKSLVYAADIEHADVPSEALVALAHGADLLIHDTMYSLAELERSRGWGHSTAEAAFALAKRAGVKRLAGFHHNPRHDDETLLKREVSLARLFDNSLFLREGESITL